MTSFCGDTMSWSTSESCEENELHFSLCSYFTTSNEKIPESAAE